MSDDIGPKVAQGKRLLDRVRENLARSIRGKADVLDQTLVALAAGGHLLIEDLPGLGKTTLAYALARSMGGSFSRIQFTSDLLPGDVTGVAIYDERERSFVFKKGPIFANIVLADEINRGTPKTQSALLEVMERSRVTVDGESHSAGAPFMVVATQNPMDYEGTFPLPESQMDRFLLRLHMGYPSASDELEILRRGSSGYDSIPAEPVAEAGEVLAVQALVPELFVEESVLAYLRLVVEATRGETLFRAGASVRAGLALKRAAQARALLEGRDFVTPQDVLQEVPAVLVHRLGLRRPPSDPLEERRLVSSRLDSLVESLPVPQ